MNIFLWILQTLLALHTIAGAVWKFSNSEQAVPSLNAIPHGVWLGLIAFELLCGLGLIIPALSKRLEVLAPIASIGIALEMLLFTGVHIHSGDANSGHIVYWLVVAGFCAFIAFGRLAPKRWFEEEELVAD